MLLRSQFPSLRPRRKPGEAIQRNETGLLRRYAPRNDTVMDPNSPLLFFDSGVGGLSVLAPTRALLPQAPIVYAADSAGFPYGNKSEEELAAHAIRIEAIRAKSGVSLWDEAGQAEEIAA